MCSRPSRRCTGRSPPRDAPEIIGICILDLVTGIFSYCDLDVTVLMVVIISIEIQQKPLIGYVTYM